MATFPKRVYYHYGIVIPYEQKERNDQYMKSARVKGKERREEEGYILLDAFAPNVFSVQSIATEVLLVNKLVRPWQEDRGPAGYYQEVPEELRISTAPIADCRLPQPRVVNNAETIHFVETFQWQRLDNDVYSICTRYALYIPLTILGGMCNIRYLTIAGFIMAEL